MRFRTRNKKNLLVITSLLVLMFGACNTTAALASEPNVQVSQQQATKSPLWEGTGDTWRIRKADNSGYLTNSWFQDLDGSWYMFGADGIMFSGLITDQSTGQSYLLNTNHDGMYGKMLTVDGAYTINNEQVYLTFSQAHDGTYGAITSGLLEVRNGGVRETVLKSIPTDSAETQSSDIQGQQQSWNTIDLENEGTDSKKTTSNNADESWKTKPFDKMTSEEMDRYIEWRSGGGVTGANIGTIDIEANRGMNLQG